MTSRAPCTWEPPFVRQKAAREVPERGLAPSTHVQPTTGSSVPSASSRRLRKGVGLECHSDLFPLGTDRRPLFRRWMHPQYDAPQSRHQPRCGPHRRHRRPGSVHTPEPGRRKKLQPPTIAQIAGVLLDAVRLDAIEADVEPQQTRRSQRGEPRRRPHVPRNRNTSAPPAASPLLNVARGTRCASC